MPLPCLAAGLSQDEPADGQDHPGLLGQREELAREEQPALGVFPAHQRLDLADPARLELDHRLVVDPEFPPLDGPVHLGRELQAIRGAGAHVGVEHLVVGLLLLCFVHRGVRVAQEGVGVDAAVGRTRNDPDAGLDEHLLASQLEGGAQSLGDALGHLGGLVQAGDVFQEDGELVPAETRERVSRAQALLETPACRDEQTVPLLVPEAVVHQLEVVQVHEEHGDLVVASIRAGQGVFQAVREQGPVRQVGQGVVQRLVAEDLLAPAQGLLLGHHRCGRPSCPLVPPVQPGQEAARYEQRKEGAGVGHPVRSPRIGGEDGVGVLERFAQPLEARVHPLLVHGLCFFHAPGREQPKLLVEGRVVGAISLGDLPHAPLFAGFLRPRHLVQ